MIAPNTLKPNILTGYKQSIYNHVIPRIGRVKLKDITPQMLDSLFRELQTSGNLERSFKLKDNTIFNEYGKEKFLKDKGLERGTFYRILRGETCRRQTAEKIAAALGMTLEKVFEDVTENKGMSGASVNKLKLNLSAIFTAACRKEIMRRNPCKLVTPPKVDTPPAAFLDEEQSRLLLAAAHERSDFQLEVIINLFLAAGLRIMEQLDELFKQRDEFMAEQSDGALSKSQYKMLTDFLKNEQKQTEFDKDVFTKLVEKVIVNSREDICFVFKDGTEIKKYKIKTI